MKYLKYIFKNRLSRPGLLDHACQRSDNWAALRTAGEPLSSGLLLSENFAVEA